MKHTFFGVLLLALALSPAAATDTQAKPDPKYEEIFVQIWTTINDNFFDPNFLGVDWKAVRTQYGAKVAAVRDDAKFAELMNEMVRRLPVTHLGVRPPEKGVKLGIAVKTVDIGSKKVVASVDAQSDAYRQGIRPGDIVLTDEKAARGGWGTKAEISLQDCGGHLRSLSVRREPMRWPPPRPSIRWRVLRPTPEKELGYIQILDFEDDKRDDFAPLVDKAMGELSETDGLIIDIRDNPGGNLSLLRLVSYVTPKPQFAVALLSRPFLQKMGHAPDVLSPEAMAKLPRVTAAYTTKAIVDAMKENGGGAAFYTEEIPTQYKGKIVVLMNGGSSSAAEGFAGIMKGHPNTILVGRKTAGVMAGAENFDMPYGWTLRFPTHSSWRPDGRSWRDESIPPDVEVPLTRQDVCNDVDNDFAKAFDLLTNE